MIGELRPGSLHPDDARSEALIASIDALNQRCDRDKVA